MANEKPGCLAAIFGIKPKQVTYRHASISASELSSDIMPVAESQPLAPPYRLTSQIFSLAEANFYRILKQLVGNNLLIFPKLSLKEFLQVTDQPNFQSHYNRIDRKHIDFLLCDSDTLQPVFAIELDDSSHRQAERGQRDIFVETILAKAGLPLVRIPVRTSYNTQELSVLFKNAIQNREIRNASQENSKQIAEATKIPPLCPTHGIQMVLRTAKHGNNVGERFWGCPNYPQCREIIKIN